MRKILSIMVVGFLIASSIGVLATNDSSVTDFKIKTMETTFDISKIQISEKNIDNYIEITLEDVNTYKMTPGEPMLPKIIKTFELPFGARNVNVEMIPGKIVEKQITKEIIPSPSLLPLVTLQTESYVEKEKDLSIYSSSEPYPNDWYEYSLRSGLNSENKRVIFLTVPIYPVRYIPHEDKILILDSCDIKIDFEEKETNSKSIDEEYDLVIIAPGAFEKQLQRLVNHKNDVNIKTFLKTTEEIYREYDGADKSEKLKYFIKDSVEKNNITYVLLVGGLKSQIFAKPKDNCNEGAKYWHLPVRYTNLYDNPKFPLDSEDVLHDPGVISDLYFADIYDGTGAFSSWDPNEDGIFAAWRKPDVEDDKNIDMMPDVALGRLACRSISEVKTLVDKIINYETNEIKDSDWFNKFTVISGDGFLDQQDLNIEWDTTGLPNDNYVVYAQSINPEGEAGPVDTINIEIDRTQETQITFNHDDHLFPELQAGYPAPPIAEIVSISPGNVLGYNDYTYTPNEGEAYNNDFNPWANISYVNGVLTIRGKSYDPKPYGNLTDIHVWIKDMSGNIIFSEWRNDTEMYYEGEWVTGEKSLYGRGGAMYYMEDFEKEIIWTSNGKLTGQDDVLTELDKGSGFLFFSGHGSPNVWADHYPGCPGNRAHGSVTGLEVTTLFPFPPFIRRPAFPIDTLSNNEKLPVVVVGGCHNSQFNVSMIFGMLDGLPYLFKNAPNRYMWCHGTPVPECFSWRLVRNPNGGAIASMGNTGLGYGMPGKVLTIGGGDGWISIEFFRQYGEHGHEILGDAYSQAIASYINTFDMTDLESGHPKTVQQWVLLGDPSLMLGGYSS